MSKEEEKILKCIGSTEETTFKEFCQALETDCPHGSEEWSVMFNKLRALENKGYIEVHRTGSKTDGFVLTEQGADYIRDKMDADRGLFGGLS